MMTIQLGDTAIDIPSRLEWRDDDGTLVAYLPQTDFANLRFSLLSTRDQAGNPVAGAGVRSVKNSCAEANGKLQTNGDTVWYSYTKPASEGAEGSLMYFWSVGMDAYQLIISCFVDATMQDSAETAFVLSSVEPTIRSFRNFV